MDTFNNSLSILLADDDRDDRFFFKEALKETGIPSTIETVNDGEQLMDYLTNSMVVFPNIVFVDLNMPRKGGLECLEEIRNNVALKDLIVAIYSTSSSPRDITDSFSKGANIYIKKPNDYVSLAKLLAKVLNINWQSTPKFEKEDFVISI